MTNETPDPALAVERLNNRLSWFIDSPISNRCITCGHVKHNDLGYCQTGDCGCEVGSTVGATATIVKRDLPALLAEVRRAAAAKALTDLADDIDSSGYGWTRVVDAERFKDRLRDRATRIAREQTA